MWRKKEPWEEWAEQHWPGLKSRPTNRAERREARRREREEEAELYNELLDKIAASTAPPPATPSLEDLKQQRYRNLEILIAEFKQAQSAGDDLRALAVGFLFEAHMGDLEILDWAPAKMKSFVHFTVERVRPWYQYWLALASSEGRPRPAEWEMCLKTYGEDAANQAHLATLQYIEHGIDFWTAAGSQIPISADELERIFPSEKVENRTRFLKTGWFYADKAEKGEIRTS